MAKDKVKKTSAGSFPKGGSTKMAGKGHAGPQTPGQTASMNKSDGGKFAKGGSGKMAGKGHAGPAMAGRTAK